MKYNQAKQQVVKQVSELLNISEKNAEVVVKYGTIMLAVIEAVDYDLYFKIKELLLKDKIDL